MSYDLRIAVKIEGLDQFTQIAEPYLSNPTYNLRDMLVACMDWDYTQGEYYPCKDVLPKVERGITELRTKPRQYDKYNSPNGWGTREGAIEVLESLQRCILEEAENIPIEHLWMAW